MATQLHQVRQNFIYRMELISPTYTGLDRRFKNVDRLRLGGRSDDRAAFGNATGRARDFIVQRRASDQDVDPSHLGQRCAWHRYVMQVAYPTCLGLEDAIHEIMDKDRHDIDAAMRLKATFVGVTGDASQVTGLKKRTRVGDELDDKDVVWTQTYVYECFIWESI